MIIIKLESRGEVVEWLDKEAMWVGKCKEAYNVMSENEEEAAILYDVIERAVDAGIEVWDIVTSAKKVHKVGEVLMRGSVSLVSFEAIGCEQIEKLQELLKKLAVRSKERGR